METVFNALSTRKVLNPAKFPTSIPIVAYPDVMTTKSSQFHGFLKYVYLFSMKPFAIDLMIISAVYIARKMYLKPNKIIVKKPHNTIALCGHFSAERQWPLLCSVFAMKNIDSENRKSGGHV